MSDHQAASIPDVLLRLQRNDLILVPHSPDLSLACLGSLQHTLRYDKRFHQYRTLPIYYAQIRAALERKYSLRIEFDPAPALEAETRLTVSPRPYQEEAIGAWEKAGRRGTVVLPTGAGKTLVGLMAIERAKMRALVLVPTINLLQQWRENAIAYLGIPPEAAGTWGGGSREICPITIMTYDSAVIYPRELLKFGMLVFDEVHHLPAASYRAIAEGSFATARLGLSATPERADDLHKDLDFLVGPQIYRREPAELAQSKHIADYIERRISVRLNDEEKKAYTKAMRTYRGYLGRQRVKINSPADFTRFVVWRSAFDPQARQALLAHIAARNLAFNARAKIEEIGKILHDHRNEKVIIFSEYNALVDDISRHFCLPAITHRTKADERTAILDGFRSNRFSKLVTGRVLNEGVDVPDANIAILVSGNATRREYIQRLGRILRPKQSQAILYELVSANTTEVSVADRRTGANDSKPDDEDEMEDYFDDGELNRDQAVPEGIDPADEEPS